MIPDPAPPFEFGCSAALSERVQRMLDRAHALGIGFLSGGYGGDELIRAGAYRVFDDPADMLIHIDEVGGRR